MDRQLLEFLAPMLQKDIDWMQMEYSWLVNAFTIAYGAGTPIFGRVIDNWGPQNQLRRRDGGLERRYHAICRRRHCAWV
ncbi:MAG: hypothetical protein ACSLEN_04375 [Candidatus Malihini olakiniferum]